MKHEIDLDAGQLPAVGEDVDVGGDAAHEQIPKLDRQKRGGALIKTKSPFAFQSEIGKIFRIKNVRDLLEPRVHQSLFRFLAFADDISAE